MFKGFSFQKRLMNITKMQKQHYDLVIVGGGITGAGVARDAASRGMKVALIEARDFSEGTSSRSSKLIHGGIRYLENLEFGLVFEALSERSHLFEMAPHLVHPLRFMLPVYKNSRVGMFKLGLGMWLYDALALFQAPRMHEHLNKEETLERMPYLDATDLKGSYEYSDAYMDDDRLVIETLRSADLFGAHCVNYVEAQSPVYNEQGKLVALKCKDKNSGKTFEIQGQHFVSSVGPWTDIFAESLFEKWQPIMRPSKGVHLTFSKERFPLEQAVVMAEGSRIVFGIPRHEMVIVGTTDTDFKDRPEEVASTQDDVDYILQVANEYFPKAKLQQSDIIASYSGVRPLVDDGSDSEGKTSREHSIFSDPRGVTFVTGGKYTTYRHMAEQTVNEVLDQMPVETSMQWPRTQTYAPLNPKITPESFRWAQIKVEEWSEEFGLALEQTQKLVDRHGPEAKEILQHLKNYSSETDPELQLWLIEAEHAIQTGMCLNLADFYLRRSPLFLSYPDNGFKYLRDIAEVFKSRLLLSEEQLEAQKNALHQHRQHEMSWANS